MGRGKCGTCQLAGTSKEEVAPRGLGKWLPGGWGSGSQGVGEVAFLACHPPLSAHARILGHTCTRYVSALRSWCDGLCGLSMYDVVRYVVKYVRCM